MGGGNSSTPSTQHQNLTINVTNPQKAVDINHITDSGGSISTGSNAGGATVTTTATANLTPKIPGAGDLEKDAEKEALLQNLSMMGIKKLDVNDIAQNWTTYLPHLNQGVQVAKATPTNPGVIVAKATPTNPGV